MTNATPTPQVAVPKAILIRPADSTKTCEEGIELARFYERNWHPSVKERGPDELLKAIDDGLVTIAENEAGEWLGVSCCFYKPGGDYAEIGGVRVIFERWGLQSLLMAASALTSHEMSPVNKGLFSITGDTNGTTQKNLAAAGFQQRAPSPRLLVDCHVNDFDPVQKVFFFMTPPGGRPPIYPFQHVVKTFYTAGALVKNGHAIPLTIRLRAIDLLIAAKKW